ncbi:MAG: hypothetical protein CL539_06120 [Alcanivorax sp.]|jgi:hypothetical protein|nr:hypothetical protein [Alcanivorax sp.]
MSQSLEQRIIEAVRVLGPSPCAVIAAHIDETPRAIGQRLRFMGEAGQIVKVGLTSSNAAIWAERCDRVSELMHKFITSPSGVPL